MNLKGQNLRIAIIPSEAHAPAQVVAKSTGCTITLNNNTEEASHKDVLGMASMPVVTSKGYSISVDSLDVSDAAALLRQIQSCTPFIVEWDETSTTDNQTRVKATFARRGLAYINDLTLTFNDREISAKQVQLIGTDELTTIPTSETWFPVAVSQSFTRGQFVRLFLGNDNSAVPSRVIGAARQLSLHVALTLENSTSKDTEGDWEHQEPTGISFDINSTALTRSGETITSEVLAQGLADLEEIHKNGTPVRFLIANVSGANQRTMGTVIVSGSVILQTLTINAPNRQDSDYSSQMVGYGSYTVGD